MPGLDIRLAATLQRREAGKVQPDGEGHAYLNGTSGTLCGVSLGLLPYIGPLRWEQRPAALPACGECSRQAAAL